MNNRHNPKGVFIGCVSDQGVVDTRESQLPGSKVSAAVALVRERNQLPDRFQNLNNYSICGFGTVGGDELANLVKIIAGFRMEGVSTHERECCLSRFALK